MTQILKNLGYTFQDVQDALPSSPSNLVDSQDPYPLTSTSQVEWKILIPIPYCQEMDQDLCVRNFKFPIYPKPRENQTPDQNESNLTLKIRGGGGNSHVKRSEMFIEKFELNHTKRPI